MYKWPDTLTLTIDAKPHNLHRDLEFGSAGMSDAAQYIDKSENKKYIFKLPKDRKDEIKTQKQVINVMELVTLLEHSIAGSGMEKLVYPPGTSIGYISLKNDGVNASTKSGYNGLLVVSPVMEATQFDEVFHRIVKETLTRCIVKKTLTREEAAKLAPGCWDKPHGSLHEYKPMVEDALKDAFTDGCANPNGMKYSGAELAKALGQLYAMALIFKHEDILQDYGLSNCGINPQTKQPIIIDLDPSLMASFSGLSAYVTATYDPSYAGAAPTDNPARFEHAGAISTIVNPQLPRQNFDLIQMALDNQKDSFLAGMDYFIQHLNLDACKAEQLQNLCNASPIVIAPTNTTESSTEQPAAISLPEEKASSHQKLMEELKEEASYYQELMEDLKGRYESTKLLCQKLKQGQSFQDCIKDYKLENIQTQITPMDKLRNQADPSMETIYDQLKQLLSSPRSSTTPSPTSDTDQYDSGSDQMTSSESDDDQSSLHMKPRSSIFRPSPQAPDLYITIYNDIKHMDENISKIEVEDISKYKNKWHKILDGNPDAKSDHGSIIINKIEYMIKARHKSIHDKLIKMESEHKYEKNKKPTNDETDSECKQQKPRM